MSLYVYLGWKVLSYSHGQELVQLADLVSDWLFTLLQPIRSLLTQLLTMTITHKFPSLEAEFEQADGAGLPALVAGALGLQSGG